MRQSPRTVLGVHPYAEPVQVDISLLPELLSTLDTMARCTRYSVSNSNAVRTQNRPFEHNSRQIDVKYAPQAPKIVRVSELVLRDILRPWIHCLTPGIPFWIHSQGIHSGSDGT